jgi:hypothetical protein
MCILGGYGKVILVWNPQLVFCFVMVANNIVQFENMVSINN